MLENRILEFHLYKRYRTIFFVFLNSNINMKKILILFLVFSTITHYLYAQTNQSTNANTIKNKITAVRKLVGSNNDLAIKKLEELKAKAESENDDATIFEVNYELTLIYMNVSSDFDKAVKLTYEMENYIQPKKDYIKLAEIQQMRGVIYLELDFYKKGLEQLEIALKTLQLAPKKNIVYLKKAIIYNNISDYYHDTNNYDKEFEYKQKSLKETLKMSELDNNDKTNKKLMLAFINVQLGAIKENNKELDSAYIYYNTSNELFHNYGNDLTLYGKVSALKGLSSISFENKEYKQAISYAENALASNIKNDQPKLRRDLYLLLQKSFLEINETDSAKKYLELYSKINDSILTKDKQQQTKAVNTLITENDEANNKKIRTIVLLSILGLIIILIIIYFYTKRASLNQKKKYLELIQRIKEEKNIRDNERPLQQQLQTTNINNDTLYQILNSLKKFEKSKKFLSNTVSLSTLATDLSTNTKYLSQIINEQKGKSFNNYINTLRINYICEELYNNTQIRKYKIATLAEMCGFSSREVFTSVFKKETGINPSIYIKNLEENN